MSNSFGHCHGEERVGWNPTLSLSQMNNANLFGHCHGEERVGWNPTLCLKTRAVVMSVSISLTSTRKRVFVWHLYADEERGWNQRCFVVQRHPVIISNFVWIGGKNLPLAFVLGIASHFGGQLSVSKIKLKNEVSLLNANRPCLVFIHSGWAPLVCNFRCKGKAILRSFNAQ